MNIQLYNIEAHGIEFQDMFYQELLKYLTIIDNKWYFCNRSLSYITMEEFPHKESWNSEGFVLAFHNSKFSKKGTLATTYDYSKEEAKEYNKKVMELKDKIKFDIQMREVLK